MAVAIVATIVTGCETSSTLTTGPSPDRCQLTLTTPAMLDATGGTSTFAITTQPECAWDVTSAADWISGLSPASGQGSRSVQFQVAPNNGTASRDGDIVVKDQRVHISQRAPCRFDVAPASQNMVAGGGSGNVTVTAGSDCAWTATTNASWITLSAPANGTGNGVVRFTVAPNGNNERSGAISIAGQTATVVQSGTSPAPAPSPCSYTLSSKSQNIGAAGGAGNQVSVSTSTGCQWTAASNVGWMTITSGGSGTGGGSVAYTVASNIGALRVGTLTIAGQAFTVTQAACAYTIAPTTQNIGPTGGAGSVTVSTLSSCQWTASSSVSWISVTSGANGTGNGTVALSVTVNTGSERSGALTIAGQTATVVQAAPCSFSMSPSDQTVGAAGGSGTISVTTQSGCQWTAVSTVPWIVVQSGVTNTGSSRVSYSVDANSGGSRTGTIAVANQVFTVTQAAH